jgi:HlyD family secretion protein
MRQAELDARRLADLAEQGFVPSTQREQAALTLDLRRQDLEAAKFEADAALHELDQARAAVGRLSADRSGSAAWEVRAPVSGLVLRIAQEGGGPIQLGASILELGDVTRLEAVVDVLTSEATQIAPQAFVTLTAGEGVSLAGRVRTVEPAAITKVSALGIEEQRVNVVVDLLPNPTLSRLVGDGYRVDARIEVQHVEDALQVPVAALFRSGREWAVFAVEEGRARLRTVQLGPRNEEHAVVTRGLDAGARVIVYPSDRLRDGSRVDIAREPA